MPNSTSLRKLYISEITREIKKFQSLKPDLITEESISHLPDPVMKHFRC